jgi:hypothetical protein
MSWVTLDRICQERVDKDSVRLELELVSHRGLMPREALTESAMARTTARSWPFDGLTAAGLQSYRLPDRSIDR